MSIFSKILGDANKRYVDKVQPAIDQINSLAKDFEGLSDEQLKLKTEQFKEELKNGKTLDDILPRAFAAVREASRRNLKQRHFDVQLIGGIALHQGRIAEMKTGEGKTLTATLPLYLNALEQKGCQLVTVNDYLSRRDCVWMGQVYDALGLSVSCINHEQSFIYDPTYKKDGEEKDKMRDNLGAFYIVEDYLRPCTRQQAYQADITYGTNNEFGFDYLKDNMVFDLKDKVQRDLNFAIIDEVDSILIDEARTPLIISAPDMESSNWYKDFAKLIPQITKSDYDIDEKLKAVTLKEEGVAKIEKILGLENIYEDKGIKYLHYLEQALRAQTLFERDRDYVVRDGEVVIVDQFTGRLMPGRRWSGGLHQAIEAKEGVAVQPESITMATVTFQNYFRMYKKIGGMTGTAATSAEEFDKVYGLESTVIPTNKKLVRQDLPDRIYKTELAKFKAVAEEIEQCNKRGQPVLVGTTSIQKNELLAKILERKTGVPFEVLNAKNHEREGQIIAQAGKLGAITIATNMAGRGVDILLGGNPSDPEEAEKVRELGGLRIIGTERHEARRIDNQLRGRAGRQGDPGSTQFFVSLDDDLMRIFGGDNMKALMERFNLPDDLPLENGIISRSIESAQSKVEGINFDSRKHLLDYDDVLNKHREVYYQKRKDIITKEPEDLKNYVLEIFGKAGFSADDHTKKESEFGAETMRQVEKNILLRVFDMLWVEHLENMESLRDSVRLRAYGQRDPLVEYKSEGHRMFQELLGTMETTAANSIMKSSPRPPSGQASLAAKPQNPGLPKGEVDAKISNQNSGSKPGRNDPCPCGKIDQQTGNPIKYKKCHGA
ncbi:MAG: preprotein translocase subunit SecA [Candidatus Paceibacterota bacterium]|jgi:preprotein translocase subunit SecA